MSPASISRLPERPSEGMRTTDAQDVVIDGADSSVRRRRILIG
jgi:hypothetical protein